MAFDSESITDGKCRFLSALMLYSIYLMILLLGGPATIWADDPISAITMPVEDVTLSFVQAGRVAKIHVKEGDQVQPGQLLIQLDDTAEQTQLRMLKEQSEDMTDIQGRKALLEQKKVYLERLQWAAGRGSATEMEVKDAKLDVQIAEFSLKKAEFEHEQNVRKYEEAKIRLDNMSLKSPIQGRVEKIEVNVGESIDGLAKALRVVKTNPLWIDVHRPLEKHKPLKLGQTVKVTFPSNEKSSVNGKIIFIATVADAASATLRVRIEVPNKINRPAGELVNVSFEKQ